MGMPEGEEREKLIERLFEEITIATFPNLIIQLIYRSRKLTKSQGGYTHRSLPRHTVLKLLKAMEKEKS